MRREGQGVCALFLAAAVASCSTTPENPEGSTATDGQPLSSSQAQKLQAADAAPGDRLGSSIAIANDNIFLGVRLDDVAGVPDRGSVYVFTRNGSSYAQTQQLSPSDLFASNRFGISMAASGDTLLVGANRSSSGDGAVYAYTRTAQGFVQQQKLVPSDWPNALRFATSLAMSGTTAAVAGQGSIYVFEKSGETWAQTEKVFGRPGDVAPVLAMSNDMIVAGFSCDNAPSGPCRGSVSIYVRSGNSWGEQQVLLASDGVANDRFGSAVAVAGNTVLIGAPGRGQNKGAAYVFTRSGSIWSEQQTLVGADGVAGNLFGQSVALQPDHALIGPFFHDHPGVEPLAGTAYVFTRSGNTWTQREEIRASDGQNNDYFGQGVALSNDIMVVGAPNDDGPQYANGSAYVFQIQRVTGDPCATNTDCPSGFCSDGRCCDTACAGSCDVCSLATGSTADGVCSVGPAGAPGSPPCFPFTCDGVSPTCSAQCALPPSPFVRLSAGMEHTCGVRADSSVACWGYSPYYWGQTAPTGQLFTAIEAGSEHTIALRLDGTIAFWGNDQSGLGTVPTGTFQAISAGYLHDCAIRSDATLACWGWNGFGQTAAPGGSFRSVSTGATHSCGLRVDGTIACWGSNDWGESTPPVGQFQAVSTRGQQACALGSDGTLTCWGRSNDLADWAPPPAGVFHSVQSRSVSGCAMTPTRTLTCWGNGSAESMAPSGVFVDYAIGNFHGCAIRPDRTIACWGRNVHGQATPP
jgi:hypothetical protein